jgi:hypothetical protein
MLPRTYELAESLPVPLPAPYTAWDVYHRENNNPPPPYTTWQEHREVNRVPPSEGWWGEDGSETFTHHSVYGRMITGHCHSKVSQFPVLRPEAFPMEVVDASFNIPLPAPYTAWEVYHRENNNPPPPYATWSEHREANRVPPSEGWWGEAGSETFTHHSVYGRMITGH